MFRSVVGKGTGGGKLRWVNRVSICVEADGLGGLHEHTRYTEFSEAHANSASLISGVMCSKLSRKPFTAS